jgi:putative proteasome-type protease
VLDRVSHPSLSLEDGARLALVSLDATARSNVTVGAPFELAIYRKDSLVVGQKLKFEQNDPELMRIQALWQEGMVSAFRSLPRFSWELAGE